MGENSELVGKKVITHQVRSAIGRNGKVQKTLEALGLGRIGRKQEMVLNDSCIGMLRKVRHLVTIKNI